MECSGGLVPNRLAPGRGARRLQKPSNGRQCRRPLLEPHLPSMPPVARTSCKDSQGTLMNVPNKPRVALGLAASVTVAVQNSKSSRPGTAPPFNTSARAAPRPFPSPASALVLRLGKGADRVLEDHPRAIGQRLLTQTVFMHGGQLDRSRRRGDRSLHQAMNGSRLGLQDPGWGSVAICPRINSKAISSIRRRRAESVQSPPPARSSSSARECCAISAWKSRIRRRAASGTPSIAVTWRD